MAPVLLVEGLAVAGPPPMTNINLQLAPGEIVALAGPAALARSIAFLPPPPAGRVVFAGQDLARLRPAELRALRRRLTLVSGDPAQAFPPRHTLGEALREPLEIHQLGTPAERPARAAAAAAALGLPAGLLARPIQTLSTGLRLAAALSRALTLQPELLIVAEAAAYVEPAVVPPLLDRLIAYCRARTTACLWVDPELAPAPRWADRALRLDAGQLRPA